MKTILLMLIIFPCWWLPAGDMDAAHDKRFPPYEPDRSLYQRLWPWPKRVSIPITEIDIKRENELYLAAIGRRMVYFGGIALVLGIAASVAVRNQLIDTIGAFVGASGGGAIIVGLLEMKAAELWIWISAGLLIMAAIAAVWYFRGKGLPLKRKPVSAEKGSP